MHELSESLFEVNTDLIQRSKEDIFSSELMLACQEDSLLGRMSPPRLIEMSDLASVLLSPRFGVAQGAFSF